MMGQVRPEDVRADHVELTIKGVFVPRADLYRFLNAIEGETAYGGKMFDLPVRSSAKEFAQYSTALSSSTFEVMQAEFIPHTTPRPSGAKSFTCLGTAVRRNIRYGVTSILCWKSFVGFGRTCASQ